MNTSTISPVAPPMPAASPSPTYVLPKSNSNKGVIILLVAVIIILLIAVVAVFAYFTLNNNSIANTSTNTTNTTAETNTTTNSTSNTTQQETTVTKYESIVPAGWTKQTDTASGVTFALPAQDSYEPKMDFVLGTSTATANQDMLWYVKTENLTDYLAPNVTATLALFKTPNAYDRSLLACGIGCVQEDFLRISYTISTKTSAEAYADFKTNAETSDATSDLPVGYDKTMLGTVNFTKWGQDVYQIRIRAGGDSPERNRYVFGTGSKVYNIDFYSTNYTTEATQVLDSLSFN